MQSDSIPRFRQPRIVFRLFPYLPVIPSIILGIGMSSVSHAFITSNDCAGNARESDPSGPAKSGEEYRPRST